MVAGASNQANWLDPAMAAPPIVKKTNYASDYINYRNKKNDRQE